MTNIRKKSGTSKAKMLRIARRLFRDEGYFSTSIRDIARAYGCKPANIYNFFPGKEEILFEVLREEMEKIMAPISHIEEDEITSPEQQLRTIIESHLEVTLTEGRAVGMRFDVSLDKLSTAKRKAIVDYRDAFDRIVRKVIMRGIERGCFIDIDVNLTGFMIASMITRTRVWFQPKKGVSVSELADFIYNFAIRSLKGEPVPAGKSRLGVTSDSGKAINPKK